MAFVADLEENKADATTVSALADKMSDITGKGGDLERLRTELSALIDTKIAAALSTYQKQLDTCADTGKRWSSDLQKCVTQRVQFGLKEDTPCHVDAIGTVLMDPAVPSLAVCASSGWEDLEVQPAGLTKEKPAASCADIKSQSPASESGFYFVRRTQTGTTFRVYCDMVTDGGGWELVSTQKPDGLLRQATPVSTVGPISGADGATNQKFEQGFYDQLASLSEYQVMAEENTGPDRDTGVVMMYIMGRGQALSFSADLPMRLPLRWHTGGGSYTVVQDNKDESNNWWGLSVHGDAGFIGVPSNKRCTVKRDFAQTLGTNGDYKVRNGLHAHCRLCCEIPHLSEGFSMCADSCGLAFRL